MSLVFQNSQWLWALLIPLLPILVHLIARSLPPKYHFSSLKFLDQIIKKSARWQKPKDILLLLLRCLAILAIILTILGLTLFSKTKKNSTLAETSYVIVIDRTASMMAKDGGASRFENATKKAKDLLLKLNPDQANVVWIDSSPQSVYPTAGSNLSFLVEELQEATPRPEQGIIPAALQLAEAQLQSVTGNKELIIISDFQESTWKDVRIPTADGLTVRKIAVGKGTPVNLAIKSLSYSPSRPIMGQPILVQANVANYTDQPRLQIVTLDFGGIRESSEIEVAPWSEAEVIFKITADRTGALPITASLEADEFSADDQFYATIDVRESIKLHVLQGAKSAEEEATWLALGKALPWLEVSASNSQVSPADFIFVSEWTNETDLSKFPEKATLILQPTAPFNAETLNALSPEATFSDVALAPNKNSEGWSVLVKKPEFPAFALFKNGEFGSPFAGRFKERLALPAVPSELGMTLGAYEDGVPALARLGDHFLWNLPLARSASTWSDQSTFLPFIAEFLLAAQRTEGNTRGSFFSGVQLSWVPNEELPQGATLQLFKNNEELIDYSKEIRPEGSYYSSTYRTTPGLYHWKLSSQDISYSAVNFPPSESDLRTMDPNFLLGETTTTDSITRETAQHQGIPLWKWLLLAAVFFLVAESLLSNIRGRRKAPLPVS